MCDNGRMGLSGNASNRQTPGYAEARASVSVERDAAGRLSGARMPLIFGIVVAGVAMLVIFFGAWAVSVDASSQDRQLSFGMADLGAGSGAEASAPSPGAGPASVEFEQAGTSADTWWGGTLLLACPFH